MGKPYSGDLRERIYREIADGGSRRSAALRFGVSASTGVRLAQRMRDKGSLAPARQGRAPRGGQLTAHRDLLFGWVEADKDITMFRSHARRCAVGPPSGACGGVPSARRLAGQA